MPDLQRARSKSAPPTRHRSRRVLFVAAARPRVTCSTDAADDPVLEPAPGETPLWPTIRDARAVRRPMPTAAPSAASALGAGRRSRLPLLHFELLADRAWEREWLRDFHPMRFGRRLWVCPGRPAAPATRMRSRVELDPGLAFGTGTHATTALCLEWLDGRDLAGRRAHRLRLRLRHPRPSPRSSSAPRQRSRSTSTRRRCSRRGERRAQRRRRTPASSVAESREAAAWDVLVANILAGPLAELAGPLGRLLRPNGPIALSGLLHDQVEPCAAAYRPWFISAPPRRATAGPCSAASRGPIS